MNKTILIIPILLVVALGGSSFWFGKKTEETYYRLLNQGERHSALVVKSESYSRGWLTSTAKTRIEIPRPGEAPITLTLDHTLHHGPFPFTQTSDGHWQLRPMMAIIETRLAGEEEDHLPPTLGTEDDLAQARAYTTVRFDGSGRSWISLPTLHQSALDGKAYASTWDGIVGTGTFSADGTEGTGTLKADSLRVLVPEGEVLMTDLESNFRFSTPPAKLTRGEGDFGIAEIRFGDENLTLTGLQGRCRGTVEDETATYTLSLGFDELKVQEESYGPVGLALELRRLDAAALMRLQIFIEELEPELLNSGSENVGSLILERSGALLPELLRHAPELELRHLIVKTGKGDFFAKGILALGKGETADLPTLPGILHGLRAEGEINAGEELTGAILSSLVRTRLFETALEGPLEEINPEQLDSAAAEKSRKELETLLSDGFLLRDDSGYHLHFTYRDGQATLNDKPFPPQ